MRVYKIHVNNIYRTRKIVSYIVSVNWIAIEQIINEKKLWAYTFYIIVT